MIDLKESCISVATEGVARKIGEPDSKLQQLVFGRNRDWDKLIIAHPNYSVFHSAGWAKVLEDTYGHTPYYQGTAQPGRVSSLLPIMEVRSLVTGRRGVSLPFTDECPLLVSDTISASDLIDKAIEVGRLRNWRYFEWRGVERTKSGDSASGSFYGHRLNLSPDVDSLFARLDSSVRRGIRKAEKAGVRVEILTTLDAVRSYYLLHCRTRKKHGLPPQSFLFFERIAKHMLSQGCGIVALAFFNEKPIAGSIFLHLGSKAIYKFGASDASYQHLRGNNLVMWEALKWYAKQGYTSCHFGRTSMNNDGLRRYKLGYGAEEDIIRYFRFDYRRNAFVTSGDSAEGWFNRVFNLLPIPLLRISGRILYKHLS